MRYLLALITLKVMLLATPLLQVAPSFSELERELLLKEFSKNANVSQQYTPKKGWNIFTSPNGGVDVPASFKDISTIQLVATYDPQSKRWATYSPDNNQRDEKILFLNYLEPDVKFFVLAKKNTKVSFLSTKLNDSCRELQNDLSYDFVVDSGITTKQTFSKNKSISVKSRYYTHHKKGVYDDTRVMLIYPKQKTISKASFRYGPATPKVALSFAKEYEGKKFYIYDYKAKKCFEGIFPSLRIPPFPVLKEI